MQTAFGDIYVSENKHRKQHKQISREDLQKAMEKYFSAGGQVTALPAKPSPRPPDFQSLRERCGLEDYI